MDVKELMRDIDDMREHDGISIGEVCRKSGINRKTYNNWVEGNAMPNLGTLNELLDVLNIELIPIKRGIIIH